MKPYYDNGITTIYHTDCLYALAELTIPTSAVFVSDPPYNMGYHYDTYGDNKTEEAYLSFMSDVFGGERKSVIIHYPESMFKIAFKMGRIPNRVVSWVYPSNTPRQTRSIAWFGCKPDMTKDGQPYKDEKDPRCIARMLAGHKARLYDWWQINQIKNRNREKTEHPCQIPLELMNRLIKVTEPEFVIDPFAGSGTTNLACQSNGVRSIGIEMSEKYCEIIAKRLDENLSIFHNDTTK